MGGREGAKPFRKVKTMILDRIRGIIVSYLCAQLAVLYTYSCLDRIRGIIVSYLCAQLAVLYTYSCLLILIYYR